MAAGARLAADYVFALKEDGFVGAAVARRVLASGGAVAVCAAAAVKGKGASAARAGVARAGRPGGTHLRRCLAAARPRLRARGRAGAANGRPSRHQLAVLSRGGRTAASARLSRRLCGAVAARRAAVTWAPPGGRIARAGAARRPGLHSRLSPVVTGRRPSALLHSSACGRAAGGGEVRAVRARATARILRAAGHRVSVTLLLTTSAGRRRHAPCRLRHRSKRAAQRASQVRAGHQRRNLHRPSPCCRQGKASCWLAATVAPKPQRPGRVRPPRCGALPSSPSRGDNHAGGDEIWPPSVLRSPRRAR